ncbi:MAG: hypothetical protein WC483_04965 [Candidatus Paceibacterota bacterium]
MSDRSGRVYPCPSRDIVEAGTSPAATADQQLQSLTLCRVKSSSCTGPNSKAPSIILRPNWLRSGPAGRIRPWSRTFR